MAQYLLSVIEPDGPMPAPEVLDPIIRDVVEVDTQMRDAGVWVFSGGLHDPATATVLRAQDGSVVATDGPWAESKEHLGGFTIIDVPDLDAALDWGGRLARATTLRIEVRPFRDGPGS
ncbi:YciI family protein [Cellulomonas alba]|uniref:YciI family protein n=1 Tax=Cellulomonas alba TaxID=3053467 RepID=A0ABT7SG16_9CELL|nr:YciI family protein [Cellulomonas alba]MDM7855120.1 YciI family protein [Cellulomonas alba]